MPLENQQSVRVAKSGGYADGLAFMLCLYANDLMAKCNNVNSQRPNPCGLHLIIGLRGHGRVSMADPTTSGFGP